MGGHVVWSRLQSETKQRRCHSLSPPLVSIQTFQVQQMNNFGLGVNFGLCCSLSGQSKFLSNQNQISIGKIGNPARGPCTAFLEKMLPLTLPIGQRGIREAKIFSRRGCGSRRPQYILGEFR